MPEYEQWKIKTLATPYYGTVEESNGKALILPRYQRDFVWSKDKRRDLIDSILEGYPIGTLILRVLDSKTRLTDLSGDDFEASTFEILDGLQRSTTLILHRLNPLGLATGSQVSAALTKSAIPSEHLLEKINASSERPLANAEELCDKIASWVSTRTKKQTYPLNPGPGVSTYSVEEFDTTKYADIPFIAYLAGLVDRDSLQLQQQLQESDLIGNLAAFRNELLTKLSSVLEEEIPVILWGGEPEDAAKIFSRVNQGGVKLNRYQELAASWSSTITNIDSGPIHTKSHQALDATGGQTLISKTAAKNENLDLYESLIGLSELLAEKYGHIFQQAPKKKRTDGQAESVLERTRTRYGAFNVVAIACGVGINNLQALAESPGIPKLKGAEIRDFKTVANAVLDATERVSKTLWPLTYGANGETYTPAHSEASMAAMVGYFAAMIMKGSSIAGISDKAIIQHYVLDLLEKISGESNATDVAAFVRVWKTVEETSSSKKSFTLSNYYRIPPDAARLEAALDAFWVKQLEKKVSKDQTSRPRIDKVQKALVQLYAAPRASAAVSAKASEFHMDHVIPYSLSKTWLTSKPGSVYCIGAVTNLAILPQKINISKGKKSLSKFIELNPSCIDGFTKEQIWSMVPAEEAEATSFVPPGSKAPTTEEWVAFQEKVWSRMKNHFLA